MLVTSAQWSSCNMSDSEAGAESKPLQQYTWEEVRQHQSRNSLWVVIRDKVYDVTEFMDEVSLESRVVTQSPLFPRLAASWRRGGAARAGR